MKSFMLRKEDVTREWFQVDATGKVLGRLAVAIARKLMGKDKPTYTYHTDGGDYVVVTNTQGLVFNGKNKGRDKLYYRHSGKPGNLKTRSLDEMMARDANKVLELAVRRMLPKNRIARRMLERLKLSLGSEHQHTAQKPKVIEL